MQHACSVDFLFTARTELCILRTCATHLGSTEDQQTWRGFEISGLAQLSVLCEEAVGERF